MTRGSVPALIVVLAMTHKAWAGITPGSQNCSREEVAEDMPGQGSSMMQVQINPSLGKRSTLQEKEGEIKDQPMKARNKEQLARARKERLSEGRASAWLSRQLQAPWTNRSIEKIFEGTHTDKLWRHGYHRYYEKQLAAYREQPGMRILEIGADSGISLGAWMLYFKDPAQVSGIAYGVDAEAAQAKACGILPDHCDKLKIFSMDQSDKDALDDLKQQSPEGWDIIVDDGSHKPEHNIISFQNLWERVRPGGMYVIEDIETSYVDTGKKLYGYSMDGGIGVAPPKNAVEKFKQLVDVVSRKHFSQPDFTVFGGIDKDVSEVTFGDGLLFVFKKPSDPAWDKYPGNRHFVHQNDSETSLRVYKEKIMAEADPELTRMPASA